MSDIVETEPETDTPPEPPVKASKKKKIIIAAAAGVTVLLGAGGAGYMFLAGGTPSGPSAEHAEHAEKPEGEPEFVDVPPMMVNLRSPDGATRFLKVHVMLVPGTENAEQLKARLPLLLDAYQPFLRELRPEDLAGSAAVFRVKEEMLVRATAALGAGAVKDILIQDLVQQ